MACYTCRYGHWLGTASRQELKEGDRQAEAEAKQQERRIAQAAQAQAKQQEKKRRASASEQQAHMQFKDALKYARGLKLKNWQEWNAWCLSGASN